MVKTYEVIEQAIKKPPIPHEPYRQSLKAWAMYVLRDRGFKVVYAQNADFALEIRGADKLYFKVSNQVEDLDKAFNWIVWDAVSQSATLIVSDTLANG